MFEAMGEPAPRADAISPDVPPALADIIAKATDVEPVQRFQSALELSAALDAVRRDVDANVRTRDRFARAAEPASHRSLVGVGAAIVLVPACLALLGFITTATFNLTTQRSAEFATEPWYGVLIWGLRSAVAPAIYMSATAIVVAALAFVIRVLHLVPSISRPLTEIRTRTDRFATTIRLDDPLVLAQGVAALAVLALSLVLWRYRDLINAWSSTISTVDDGVLRPLSPENVSAQAVYGVVLDVLILGFGIVLYRLLKLRQRRGTRGGLWPVSLVFTVLLIFVLLWEAPYRIMWQNKRERIQVSENRCYVLGEHDRDWLVYCPDLSPPRNRIIRSSDPSVRRSGIVESIFTSPKAP
jgi:hypothetical protein